MRESEYRSRPFVKALRRRMTDAEVILWSRLQRKVFASHAFRRRHPIRSFVADFACISARLVIEVDGDTHGNDDEIEYDRRRDEFLRIEGWRVFRVGNRDVYDNLDEVLDRIASLLLPPPPASRAPPP